MFNYLYRLFSQSKTEAFKPQKSPQCLILEPILTPSGILDLGDDFVDSEDVDLSLNEIEDMETPPASVSEELLGEELEILPFFTSPPASLAESFTSGYFTVGETGEVSLDFLYDGGKYKFELAIFSLEGIEAEIDSEEFIQEAARRALSDSELGRIVIRDRAEGARFDGLLGENTNWNQGEYQGIKTFSMNPGDRLAIMLVPNGKIEQVYENPDISGAKTPLFSLATANPDDMFHLGQMSDLTGDGSTFVMEDVRSGHRWFDRDYNDLIFQIRGATGEAELIDDVIDPDRDWRGTDMGQAIVSYAEAYVDESNLELPPEPPLPKKDFRDDWINQPFVGVIDVGFTEDNLDLGPVSEGQDWIDGDNNPYIEPNAGNEAGTHRLGIVIAEDRDSAFGLDEVEGLNPHAEAWIGRADAETWTESLTEFVDRHREWIETYENSTIERSINSVANLSFPFIDTDGDTRYELTSLERDALEYARENGIILVVAAGDDGSVMPALAQASQEFDNIVTVGSSEGLERVEYSSYGKGLDILAEGGTKDNPIVSTVGTGTGTMAGTGVAASRATGAISRVWAANPGLNYRQIIDILKRTARDIDVPGEDEQTGAGLLNLPAAFYLATAVDSQDYEVPTRDDEPVEYTTGSGQPHPDSPLQAPEYLPEHLHISLDRIYNPGETISFLGAVQHREGISELTRVGLQLQKDGGEWTYLGEIADLSADPNIANQVLFDYELGVREPGKYRLRVIAYKGDSSVGATLERPFSVLSVPEGQELSDRVKLAIERAMSLEAHHPYVLERTHKWVVSVQTGLSASDLAASVGAENLGVTGHIPNTYLWEFPENLAPELLETSLAEKIGVEYAYPLIQDGGDFANNPQDEPLVTDGSQWHLQSDGNFDANITDTWEQHGVYGQGVTIGIVDGGFAIDDPTKNTIGHPDLLPNYRPDLSYDFDERDEYPDNAIQGTVVGYGPVIYGFQETIIARSWIVGEVANLTVNLDIDYETLDTLEVSLVSPSGYSVPLTLDSQGRVSQQIPDFQGQEAGGVWQIRWVDNQSSRRPKIALEHFSLDLETFHGHGTKVAGVAAARGDNNLGGSGVAPLAEWAGLRFNSDGTDDLKTANIFSHQNQNIDIYNNSWGTPFFKSLPNTQYALERAVNEGTETGRNGLGNIVVFAAGNHAAIGGNVNQNTLANARQTIAVGAIDNEGKQASSLDWRGDRSFYSAPGSSVLISAQAGYNPEISDRRITTTDLYSDDGDDTNDYTDSFRGTSAAAPLVSGAIALMLEANPDLTWRDVQHILIETAQKNDPDDDDWYQNQAGYWVNHKYGFGAIDADAAVQAAKTWIPVDEEMTASGEAIVNQAISDATDTQTFPLTSTIEITEDMELEWIEVTLNALHSHLGDLEVTLTAPDGTRSVLAQQHPPHTTTAYDFDDDRRHWTFTTARHWGESSVGTWTLEVVDTDRGNGRWWTDGHRWKDWKIDLYGTNQS
ncbi:MAG: S8 family serine peptidase [Cyanobacteria bacterium SBLK]|nr:S8 family serine peptidase [Cyanobacteria bacterium SBLK]